jgi:Zn finger protein HypA/HybF involved in hydrogenase expression
LDSAGPPSRASRFGEPRRSSPEPDASTGGLSATAREKFECPACGADAHWNPAKQALVCPFCGTESPATLQTRGADTVIVEHDLVASLRSIPDSKRGWQAAKVAVKCQSCQAVSVFDPERVGQRCEFCGSSQLVPYEQVKDAFSPESLLPFAVNESRARELVRAWYGRQWLAPNNLKKKALTDTVRGIYLPYWTFDAVVHASWAAEAGHYYYENVNGKRVQRVRWSHASGALDHVFDDELVAASTGVSAALLRKIEPFPTGTLIPYDPGYLAGWTVERYQIDLVNAATRSRAAMDAKIRQRCADDVPGDTLRNLQVDAAYTDQRFKHILAPVWLLTYTYGHRAYQVVANGVTGTMAGDRPWSWIKIALLIIVALIVLYLVQSSQ